MSDLTTAQIMFMGLAGMEDAQIKSGNGMVDRTRGDGAEMKSMSVAEYARMRQANVPGSELYAEMQARREKQKPLRAMLEKRVRQLVVDDMRRQ